ncbi:CCA tRNA nucleotidyltransferase [Lichenicola cladoniae]|uniref:CCA tRNA nucleotidyltransferase n=1 Tax=Lichenicola cladoniae TaxID=1484109 RepID=A0A6M8HVX5_9PROT|nr:CCA tRNA nucleotidyltransferase [Acetobacteraceae bacterium]QKE92450.1 CCA tRNA nucleotidyltransferase [Lichenicola cladoniae]
MDGAAALPVIWSILPDARLVGGAVRDLLAGRITADFDLATAVPPQAILDRLRERGIKVVPTGLAHGTVTAVVKGRPYEITTLRRDVETDGRHAVVAWTDDWREDAARRDFTINAMSFGRDGVLWDYFGGENDLRAGKVRFVGTARQRIEEDGLRILRFFRFQARYGTGVPDPEAVEAIANTTARLSILSAERVWSELRRLLDVPDPIDAVRLMQRLGVLDAVLPGADVGRLAGLLKLAAPTDPLLRLAALARGPSARVAERFRLSTADAQKLDALRSGRCPVPGLDDDALRRLLADEAADRLVERSWLTQIDSPVTANEWDILRHRLRMMLRPVFPLSGRDAVKIGLVPGPMVGAILRDVGDWWRAGGCLADRAACLAQLARVAAERSGN